MIFFYFFGIKLGIRESPRGERREQRERVSRGEGVLFWVKKKKILDCEWSGKEENYFIFIFIFLFFPIFGYFGF